MLNFLVRQIRFGMLAAGFAFALGSAAIAEDVIRWSGNYLAEGYTGNLYLERGDAVPLPIGKSYPDLEAAKSPKNPRYDQTLPSAVFYGAIETTSAMPIAVEKSRMQVRYNGGTNCLSIGSDPGTLGNRVIVRGLIVWKKDGFMGKFAGRDIPRLSDLGEMTLEVTGIRGIAAARFAVMSGGKWYFSEEVMEGKSDGPDPKPLGEFPLRVEQSNWGQGTTEENGFSAGEPPSEYRVPGSQLKDISAVGFYFVAEYTASNAAMFEMNAFHVTAVD